MRRYLFLSALLVTILSPQLPATAYADTEQAPTVNWMKLKNAWLNYLDYPSSENAHNVYVLLPAKGYVIYSGKPDEKEALSLIYDDEPYLSMLARQIYASDRNAVKLGFRLFTIAEGHLPRSWILF